MLLSWLSPWAISFQDGWTPIHAAVDTGNVDSLKLLMYHRVPSRGNSWSAEEPKPGSFTLNGGESPTGASKPVVPADLINHADKEGWTAAHIAASKGFKVRLLAAGRVTQLWIWCVAQPSAIDLVRLDRVFGNGVISLPETMSCLLLVQTDTHFSPADVYGWGHKRIFNFLKKKNLLCAVFQKEIWG